MIGRTTDNNGGQSWKKIFTDSPVKQEWKIFRDELANIPVEYIVKENPGILLFPHDFQEIPDDLASQYIFKSPERDVLKTGNLMGVVEYSGTILTIASRFYSDENDYFLHYMLQRVFGLHQMNWNINSNAESIWDFLPYLFPAFLNAAVDQGIYREYHDTSYNDFKVHGKIDVARNINENTPFIGRISSTNRDFSSCNAITLLIRATIEHMRKSECLGGLLLKDSHIRESVSKIRQATPVFCNVPIRKILLKNIKPINHPFYTKYRPLQQLCLQILRRLKISTGTDDKKIYGLLFDGAWLWEEYLNTLLRNDGFIHPQNKKKSDPIYLFDTPGFKRYPDFYKKNLVFDAKYKRLLRDSGGSIDRNDIHQLISYMYVLRSRNGAFLFPEKDPMFSTVSLGTLNGVGQMLQAQVFLIPLTIPCHLFDKTRGYIGFCEAMAEQEMIFMERCRSLER